MSNWQIALGIIPSFQPLYPARVPDRVANHSGLHLPPISRLGFRPISRLCSRPFSRLCFQPISRLCTGPSSRPAHDPFHDTVPPRNRGLPSRQPNGFPPSRPIPVPRFANGNLLLYLRSGRTKIFSTCGGLNGYLPAPTGALFTTGILELPFQRSARTVSRVVVGHQPKAMRDPTAAGGAQGQGDDGVRCAYWGSYRGGGRASGGLKPEIKVTIGGDRPSGLGGDAVTFEDMRELLVCLLEVRTADAYHKPRWRRPGAREEATAGICGDPNDSG